MHTRHEVVQTAVKGDDHGVARGPVQLKEMHGRGMRVESPGGDQVLSASERHGFHQIDAHAGG